MQISISEANNMKNFQNNSSKTLGTWLEIYTLKSNFKDTASVVNSIVNCVLEMLKEY